MTWNIITYEGSPRVDYITSVVEKLGVEYKFHVGKECYNQGALLHKNSCLEVIKNNMDKEYVIIVEDDLLLTEYFNLKQFKEVVGQFDSDVLLTGITAYDVRKNTLDKFRGTQLVVIFKQAYERILENDGNMHFEDILSKSMFSKKITVPFVSKQTDLFGSNLIKGIKPLELFNKCEQTMIKRFNTNLIINH